MQRDILIFISDQHAGAVMGHAGADVDTPNLDDIQRHGTSFTNAYTPCPLCVPARMAFMSGLAPKNTGIYVNNDTLPNVTPSFLHSMVDAGYETVLVGRMHFMGEDQRHGFVKRVAPEFTPTTWNRPVELMRRFRGEYVAPVYFAAVQLGIGGGENCVTYYDRMVTQAALDYLAQPHDKPQCIVVGTYGPHFPYTAPKALYEKYKKRVMLYKDFYDYPQEFAGFLDHRDMKVDEQTAINCMAAYYALVETADGQIGKVRQAFREMTRREGREGVFVYTSDHGDMNGHKGMYGKHVMFEDSARIPMLMEGDGVPEGRVVNDNVSLLDIAPTVCTLGGAQVFEEFDGRTLTDYFTGGDEERIVTSDIYETYVPNEYRYKVMSPESAKFRKKIYGLMVKYKNYKYIRYIDEFGGRTEVLYDLKEDPGERVNVISGCHDIAAKLRTFADGYADPTEIMKTQRIRARNYRLFSKYEAAAHGITAGEMWTDNPPEGRLKPEP